MSNKQILVEYMPLEVDRNYIMEAVRNPNVPLRVKAVLQRANAKNQNGRVYPKEILMRESKKYYDEFVAGRRALGELDHPESRAVVNLGSVSHVVTEMQWDGDDLVGMIEILSTPSGNIVKELLKSGIRLGVSSRGVGSVKQMSEGTVEVDEDFNLICFDIVSNPSTQGAFLAENVNNALAINKQLRINGLIQDFLSEVSRTEVKK
jgi:hypothetical protein